MEVTGLTPNQWYCITVSEACTITAEDGAGYTQTLATPKKAGQYMVKTISDKLTIDDDDHALVEGPFRVAPAGGSGGGEFDGHLDGSLYVGNGEEAAVAAVCTLTLGDLGTGGSLTDSNGQSVELDAPHAYATGHVEMYEPTNAGIIKFGEHEAIEFQSKPRIIAYMILTPLPAYDGVEIPYSFETGISGNTRKFEWHAPAGSTLEDLVSAINDTSNWTEGPLDIVAISTAGNLVLARSVQGAAGNGCKLIPSQKTPFELSEEVEFTNGQDARTAQDVVDILNASEDCPAVAVLDADGTGISFTAKEYGVNDEIDCSGTLVSNPQGMSGAHGDYTIAELLEAISAEFADITAAAGTAEGTITLTANTAGKAANAITYTATGCFGSGTTRQGSTTRGRDAVEQTDYKIYLNGNEFTGGAPAAPVPEPLGTTTTLKHGHIYTLAVIADTDLSALGVEPNATAELWIDYTAGSVTLGAWVWPDDDEPSAWTAGNRYCLVLRNDGAATLAAVNYNYAQS